MRMFSTWLVSPAVTLGSPLLPPSISSDLSSNSLFGCFSQSKFESRRAAAVPAAINVKLSLDTDEVGRRNRTLGRGSNQEGQKPSSGKCRAVRANAVATGGSISAPQQDSNSVSPDDQSVPSEADVVVIGSGLGGLCCAALLARYGLSVVVLESHGIAGGAAHSFERNGYHFDSGPSLFSGLSSRGPQANPLALVLEALGEEVPCVKYDSWHCYLPEGEFLTRIGPSQFCEVLEQYAGPVAVSDWKKLMSAVQPLTASAMALPPAALRADMGAVLTVTRFLPSVISTMIQAGPAGVQGLGKLLGSFQSLVDAVGVTDPFVRNWVDLLSFLLSGLKADGTLAAEVVYMFGEWYKPGATLEYPLGGTGAIVDALVRGLKKHGGRLCLNAHVEGVVVEGGRAVGVRVRGGGRVTARKAVVSNASVWDTARLLPPGAVPGDGGEGERGGKGEAILQCPSFMHLHLGIDAKDLPHNLEIHHIVVNDWSVGVDAPQNLVLISIPSVLDPSLAPPGKHSLHAYTPGSEPYSIWEGVERGSKEYIELKKQRAEVMWKAVEKVLGPNFKRDQCEVSLIGTPLTHARYLRRDRGTYGPAIIAGKGTFPGPKSPLPNLLCCGDSTFPGIGVPAVAASGMIAANTLVGVGEHWKMLDDVGL